MTKDYCPFQTAESRELREMFGRRAEEVTEGC